METDQFDATLGGTEHLPFSANSLKFATSRSVEIAAMTESILRPSTTKLIFQTLPVHMRRRVMSHNSKRLPQRLREGHMEQLKKSGLPPQQKRPSRKYRRRPGNLLEEYNRRKKRNIWLETHIWHAKRFHIIERWGHKIAYSPCDKAFRACYRASSAHCLMQDLSYYTHFHITGPIELITKKIKTITNSACGLSISSKAYLSGKRQGTLHLYKQNEYPFGYIGEVNFLWEPRESSFKTLWLFIHPSYKQQVKSVLCNLFELIDNEEQSYNVPEKKRRLSESKKINSITLLEPNFNMFHLTGPNSHAVLSRCLKSIESIEKVKTNYWIATYFASSDSELRIEEKNKYWGDLQLAQTPSQLPPRLVTGLIVRDPRVSRPSIRTKAQKNVNETITLDSLINIPDYAAQSPLWNLDIHKTIKEKRLTNAQYIERVTKTQLIPGEIFEHDPKLQSVPIILIQRSGSQNPYYKKIGYGSGWDIIIPSGYSMPFWQTFVMFGARAGGLRESESLTFEMGYCYLPPDSTAGEQEEQRLELELKDKYFKRPPSKRVNYIKLGINSPFKCQWTILLNDWCDDKITDYFILRDKNILMQLQSCLSSKTNLPQISNANSCLVPVYVQVTQKGNLKRHALLYLPKANDEKLMKSLFEPLHNDKNEKIRKSLRKEHKLSLKRLRRKRVKDRNNLDIKSSTNKNQRHVKKEPSEYVKKIRELWVPSSVETVRNYNCREVIGYLSQAAFSFSQAKSCGVGYIPYNALKTLVENRFNFMLVRNICSRKYRMAKFQIINT